MAEKTVMITGANSGLGFETAKNIARDKNYAVILACRNAEKADKARRDIIEETGNQNITVQILDTSDLSSVRNCVKEIKSKNISLDTLINNAGISPAHSGTTADGFELVFATNYLGHFLLTMELLPVMKEHAEIMNVTSDMHNPPQGITWKGADYIAYQAQNDRQRYSYSKLCNILFTYRLADELTKKGSSITVNCFNPGFMADTNFSGGHGKARSVMVKATMPDRYGTLESSADALAEILTDDRNQSVTGKYFDRTFGIKKSSDLSYDTKIQEELWNKSQEYTGINAETILNDLKK